MGMNANFYMVLGLEVKDLPDPSIITDEIWETLYGDSETPEGWPDGIIGESDGEFNSGLKVIGWTLLNIYGDHTNLQKQNQLFDELKDFDRHEIFEEFFGTGPHLLTFMGYW
jgi:hypothetical protein